MACNTDTIQVTVNGGFQAMWASVLDGVGNFDQGQAALIRQTIGTDNEGNNYTALIARDDTITPNPYPEFSSSLTKRTSGGDVVWVVDRVLDLFHWWVKPTLRVFGDRVFTFWGNEMHVFTTDGGFSYACSYDEAGQTAPKHLYAGSAILNSVTGRLNLFSTRMAIDTPGGQPPPDSGGEPRLLDVDPATGDLVNSWELTGFDMSDTAVQGRIFGPYMLQLDDGRVNLYGLDTSVLVTSVVTFSADFATIENARTYPIAIGPAANIGAGLIAFTDAVSGSSTTPKNGYFLDENDAVMARIAIPINGEDSTKLDVFTRLPDGDILWSGMGSANYPEAQIVWLKSDLSGATLGSVGYRNTSQVENADFYVGPYSPQTNTIVLTLNEINNTNQNGERATVIGIPLSMPVTLKEVNYDLVVDNRVIAPTTHSLLQTDTEQDFSGTGSLVVSPKIITHAITPTVKTDLTPLAEPWQKDSGNVTFTRTELILTP